MSPTTTQDAFHPAALHAFTLPLIFSYLAFGCAQMPERMHEFRTEHDSATEVSSLTDDQAVQLCVDVLEHPDRVLGEGSFAEMACFVLGVRSGDSVTACDEFLGSDPHRECLSDVRSEDLRALCSRDISRIRAECDATIEEIEVCARETSELVEQVLAMDCSGAVELALREGAEVLSASPPSCARLSTACSQLIHHTTR